ncbi:hypothetical protein [Microbacterium sp. BDGP8]|uniref:hypothetical protein n=1 Tax=Microbacterium sp. BDGP8 TaxID=3035531 RepID=UPI00249F047F|nr:hypothetical protein [Microbacterium sp. BDGP8]WHE36186.1 hypothetical protein P6897_00210 [Microbacterium sp. BDGP8]
MARPSGYDDLHRRESPEQEHELQSALFASFAQIEALHAMWSGFEVRPGTALAGDDRATPYEPTSQWLGTFVGVAFDNLRTVKLVIQDAQTMPMSAHFGLTRNALEAAGVGLWMIGSRARDTRVLRTLQLSYENRRDEHGLNSVIQGSEARLTSDDATVMRLRELCDARSGIKGRSLNPPSISERLRAAQEPAGDYPFSLLVSWKLTSGIAHGRRSAMYHLLDREVVATSETGATVWMTSSFGAAAGTCRIALQYLMRLLTIALSRNGTHLVV